MKIKQYIKDNPLMNHHPKVWENTVTKDWTILNFNNLPHFKQTVSSITQKSDNACDINYKEALNELVRGKATIKDSEYKLIKDKVREALIAKRLITREIYKGYEYSTEGDTIDVARFASGNPECCIKPKSKGKVHFYELYINISVKGSMDDSVLKSKIARLLATIELLESRKIFIKVNIVDTSMHVNVGEGKKHLLLILPLFSHREIKTIKTMSSVINERLLRKFSFAISEDLYGENLASGYGQPQDLPKVINLSQDLDEVAIATDILDQLITPCKR